MEFVLTSGSLEAQRSACLVVGIFEARELSASAKALDTKMRGYLKQVLARGDCDGKLNQTLLLQTSPALGLASPRILLIGLGLKNEFNASRYLQVLATVAATLNSLAASDVLLSLTELPVKDRDMRWKVRQAVEVIADGCYRFTRYKTKTEKRVCQKVAIWLATATDLPKYKAAVAEGNAIVLAMNTVKDLANTPPNICHPRYLAQHAQKLGKRYKKLQVKVLSVAEMAKLGMGALLAVGQGSEEPPCLITLEYRGGKKSTAPTVLVGKGITFDTGGLSLKPAANMVGMKFDMCGAATVLAILEAIAHYEWPVNVVGVVAAAENMPSGRAARPDDIVTTLSGQTVEITNTDAEGRLVLCDALTYVERFKPGVVIDMATLTGGVIVALGSVATGLFSNDEALAAALIAAGNHSYDRVWQLPIWEEYQKILESPVADFINAPAVREAHAIAGACFLARFTKKYRWAHLDIAGTANRTGKDSGATGRPVPLLMYYLLASLGH